MDLECTASTMPCGARIALRESLVYFRFKQWTTFDEVKYLLGNCIRDTQTGTSVANMGRGILNWYLIRVLMPAGRPPPGIPGLLS